MKVIVAAVSALAVAVGLSGSALAMGTGNYYLDHQTGVSYTVYQPGYTAGLTSVNFMGRTDCPAGIDEPLLATYGKKTGTMFTIEEGDLRSCSDIGNGPTVYSFELRGQKAVLVAYCDPSTVTMCKKGDVAKFGGHIEVTLPASSGLRPTTTWIETGGGRRNLTWRQMVAIARSLHPVSQNSTSPPPTT